MTLSIVIPAYNEERRLPATLHQIFAWIENSPYSSGKVSVTEVLVVDDGSTDATAAVVESLAAQQPRLGLIRNPGNRGKGYAIRHGMLKAQGEMILFTDADLSAPIEELPKLMAGLQQGNYGIAIGSRALDRSLIGVHQKAWREWSGILFNRLMCLITGLRYRDTQCGFKLFRREAALRVFPLQRLDGFSFDVEDLFVAARLKISAIEVPVRWNNVEGTRVSMAQGIASFLDLLRIRWYGLRGFYSE